MLRACLTFPASLAKLDKFDDDEFDKFDGAKFQIDKFLGYDIIAEPSAKAAVTHGAGSLIVGTLGVALVAALAVVKSRFGANAKVPTAPVLV